MKANKNVTAKSKRNSLEKKFNHWRSSDKKIASEVPHSANGVIEKKTETCVNNDCSADPCSCTGCSGWD